MLKSVVSEMLAIANLKEVETAGTENNTSVTKKDFNFTDEYIHIKKCENVGIQAKCILQKFQ